MRVRSPNITDYMAGALLANGPVWMWMMAIGYFSDLFSALPPALLGGLSLTIYLAGGSLASYLVCNRAERGLLLAALKLVAAEWAFYIMMMISTIPEPSLGQASPLLLCFIIGGLIGAYLSARRRLRRPSGD
ncbi:hypothetical protein KEJ49_03210 [Candidatus Bathyarchaeota archaeon]|nr:hypothetical protein [Candidatus Bathyarchaeota archaeon]